MPISRREFVQLSTLASASMMMPKFLQAFEKQSPLKIPNGKTLVVIQLSGGNDGLNTVIPVRNDLYYSSRPGIGIRREDTLSLSDDLALNPALKGLKDLYDAGALTILNGVGYPQPDRSHFRSMDIWQTGAGSDELLTSGWLGRYLDTRDKGGNPLAIEVDDSLSLSMKGKLHKALAIQDVQKFYNAASDPLFRNLSEHRQEHSSKLAGYLYATLRETTSAAGYVYDQYKTYNTTQTYPDTPLGKRMKTIAALILSDASPRVYYVSHGSFDTHVNQRAQQEKLFGQLSDSLTSFTQDLKSQDRFKDVVVMTFSEFGRRVTQNGSGGTDHGTASSMFFISGALKKPGIYNPLPSLSDLDAGDLKYSIDFKQAYATVLKSWLDVAPSTVLSGKWDALDFL